MEHPAVPSMGGRFQQRTESTPLSMSDTKIQDSHLKTMIQQKFADLETIITAGFDNLQKNFNNEARNTTSTCEGRDTKKMSSEHFKFGDLPAAIFSWRPGQISPSQGRNPHDISRSKESRSNNIRIERDKIKDDLLEQCEVNKTLSQQLADSNSEVQIFAKRLEDATFYINALEERMSQAERRFIVSETSAEKATKSHDAELEKERKISTGRIQELQDNTRKLQGQIASFRDMITKRGTASDEVDDAAIVSRFTALRDHIQSIVHRCYQPRKGTSPDIGKDANPRGFTHSKFWERDDLNDSEIRNQMRAFMFHYLWEVIFEKPCFGLGNSQELELGLTRFELALKEKNREYTTNVVEWRIQTIKCAASLVKQNSWPMSVAHDLFRIMSPFLPQTPGASMSNEEISNRLFVLCKDASNLALLLRSGKDTYTVETGMTGLKVPGDLAEPQGWEGKPVDLHPDHQSIGIACVVFGALVKYPEHTPSRQLVLEKAHVVVRVKEGWKGSHNCEQQIMEDVKSITKE